MKKHLCEGCQSNIYNRCIKYKLTELSLQDIKRCDGRVETVPTYKQSPLTDDKINKVDEHMKLCKELNEIYAAKNHDYGDSFKKTRDELGDIAILVRLYDKLGRLKTLLMGADAKVKGESISDTLKDLTNYALMELIEREVDKK